MGDLIDVVTNGRPGHVVPAAADISLDYDTYPGHVVVRVDAPADPAFWLEIRVPLVRPEVRTGRSKEV